MPDIPSPPKHIQTCDCCVGSYNATLSGQKYYRGRITFDPADTGRDPRGKWASCPKCGTRFYTVLSSL